MSDRSHLAGMMDKDVDRLARRSLGVLQLLERENQG